MDALKENKFREYINLIGYNIYVYLELYLKLKDKQDLKLQMTSAQY